MRQLPQMRCQYRHRSTWENVGICDGAALAIAKIGTEPFKEQWIRMKAAQKKEVKE